MKSECIIFTFLVSILAGTLPSVYAESPLVGTQAPALELTMVLHASDQNENSVQSFKGHVIVLEFWATWCAPCISVMPHLNDLAEKYKERNVKFISISDEDEDKIKSFLKKRDISGWVGIDGNRAMYNAYNIQSIPFTVVIGADNRILGYPNSRELSEEMLEKAIAGEFIEGPKTAEVVIEPDDPKKAPLYMLSIQVSALTSSSGVIGLDIYEMEGVDAFSLILNAYNISKSRALLNTLLPDERYDVVATKTVEKDAEYWSWRPPLQNLLQDLFEISVVDENLELEVYEIIKGPRFNQKVQISGPDEKYKMSSAPGVISGQKIPVATLAKNIENILEIPVVDGTEMEVNINYNIVYDNNNMGVLLESLEDETGLILRKTVKTVKVWSINPRTENKTDR